MKRHVSAIGTASSILGLAFIPNVWLVLKIVFIIMGIVSLIVLFVDAYKKNQVNQRICTNEKEIKDAMLDIIRSQGKICIMSSSLSWVDEDIKKNIINKGRRITIFAKEENDVTIALKKAGITVMFYGDKFSPQTRFTIIGYDRNASQVAVANPEHLVRNTKKLHHVIYETSPNGIPQDQWITSLAKDLIKLCKLYCEENKCAG